MKWSSGDPSEAAKLILKNNVPVAPAPTASALDIVIGTAKVMREISDTELAEKLKGVGQQAAEEVFDVPTRVSKSQLAEIIDRVIAERLNNGNL